MKLSHVTVLVCMVLAGLFSGTAGAAMVDFELPTYTMGYPIEGVDGWEYYLAASTTVTPDTWIGETRVLEGSQSMRMDGDRSIVTRPFDEGPIGYDTGTIVKARMLVDNTVGGTGEFYFSHNINPAGSSTPAGIVGAVGGNFQLFCYTSPGVAGNLDTGIPFSANTDYLLEIELDLDNQMFNAFATDMTSGGSRTSLGTAELALAGHLLPGDYATSGFALISRVAPVIYDELDVDVVEPPEPDPLQPGTVGFELPTYTAGTSIIGVDGWKDFLGATAIVTPDTGGSGDTRVLEDSQSVRLSGSRSILQRNFGPGSTYDDGSVVSCRMMIDDIAESQAEMHFSHNQTGLLTPAGIVAISGGNFFSFGFDETGTMPTGNGVDSGVPVDANVDYLLELELDLENQGFESYVTDLTNSGARTSLGSYGFALGAEDSVEPGDDSNSGWVIITRNNGVAIFDELSVSEGATRVPGDANLDGYVDVSDLGILATNYGIGSGLGWGDADFTGDGIVDVSDLGILATNYGTAPEAMAVPEPSVLVGLLGLLIGILIVRRR